ncbi:3-oxoacyl-[acyl-carrier-protein] synthase-3 [Thermanaeromonas toyohensis ToBE]|uniref:3-oxoacyl-[acyl-carrier-protein] synthase-3 n=1 Tax=Thermanaeromonas toyohensis ToBE TaxID=698762 RepID=A0A1W1W1H8_9FIRM|nr:3-oxoacyl-ACP synthase [Thermanaeromonas toyohensis]SMB99231.1 3-oxoacyl-[acyl-carrier-protein] synthase-3 [Thermanaeromonas toyohensis ToBE]
MCKAEIPVGLVDFEIYLPDTFMDASELAKLTGIPENVIREKLGVNRKPVGGPDDHCVTMAIKAAKKLLDKTGISPEEIDLIIYPGEEYKEYICWTGSIKIQKELGAYNCWAFDISYRCAATPLALKLAKDLILTNDDINTVLIAGGNTNAYLVNYEDPNQTFMFDMAPSGHAAIIKRGYEKNLILGTGIHTEPIFADDVIPLLGGTKYPITHENLDKYGWKLVLPDPERMKRDLAERSLPAFIKPVDIALQKSGLTRADIDYLAIIHIKRSAHEAILQELGLRPEQSVYLEDYGHTGHTDQYLSLQLALEQGKVKPGDHVVFLGAGTGYAFTATVIRWG